MSITQKGWDRSDAVNDSQLLMDALNLEGAHGKQIRKLEQGSTSILKHSCAEQKPGGIHSALSSPRIPTSQSPSTVTNIGKTDQQRTEEAIIKLTNNPINDVYHPEAITTTNKIIINVLTRIEKTDFSVNNIEIAIENAGAKRYNSVEDAKKDQQWKRILQKCDSKIHGYARNTIYEEKTMNGVRTYINNGKTYVCYPEIFGNPKSEGKLQNTYKLQSSCSENAPNVKQEGSTMQEKYPKIKGYKNFKDFDINKYSSQLEYEYNQFSGDIEIKKLEPGTVLVRDFGQGQSVKSSCWCLANDLSSAVSCDKDLQTQLAVKPSWNGGGNRAVFVVPQGSPKIFVAVGTIAQQKNDSDFEETVYHPGGGIQYNILTPNDCDVNNVEDTSGGFANAGKAFDKCCFVIANTGIIEANDRKTVQANQAQIKQPNPVATNGSKLQQND